MHQCIPKHSQHCPNILWAIAELGQLRTRFLACKAPCCPLRDVGILLLARQNANSRWNTHKSPTAYKCRLAQKQEYRHDTFIVVGQFSICSKHMQYEVQCSHTLLAARLLAVCAPPALPPATINRLGSGDFLADMSLYGSIAVTEGPWLLLLVHFLAQPAPRTQQC